jgi:hypothetical protein
VHRLEAHRPSFTPDVAETKFGPVVRAIFPGDSFGELALLQPHNLRTATVLAGHSYLKGDIRPAVLEAGSEINSPLVSGTELIQISRTLFDAAVTSVQAGQLEERLKLLSTIPVLQLC